MTESDLIDLGFTKIEYTKKDLEELGDSSDPYRYYTYEIFRDEDDLEDESPFVLESQATFDMNETERILLKITDLIGRETKQTNQPLFFIYDDGTVEKKLIIE